MDNFLNFRDVKTFSTLLLLIFEEKLGQCEVKKCAKGQKTKISKDLKEMVPFFFKFDFSSKTSQSSISGSKEVVMNKKKYF